MPPCNQLRAACSFDRRHRQSHAASEALRPYGLRSRAKDPSIFVKDDLFRLTVRLNLLYLELILPALDGWSLDERGASLVAN